MSLYDMVHILTSPIYIISIYLFYSSFFVLSPHRPRCLKLILLLYFIATCHFVVVFKLQYIILLINIIFLFLLSLTFPSSFQRKIVVTSFTCSICFLIEILVSFLFGIKTLNIGLEESEFRHPVGLVLIRLVTFVLAYLMFKQKKIRISNSDLPKSYYISFILVLFGTLYLFIASLESKTLTLTNVLLSGATVIITNILIITMDEKLYGSLINTQEQRILLLQNSAYEKQLSLMSTSAEALRLAKHDMNNHLAVLDEMFKNQEYIKGREYIVALHGNFTEFPVSSSSNYVLDSILNIKLGNMKEKGITVSSQVKVPMELNLPSKDVTIILGNLLDNAITACETSEERFISVEISYSLDNLVIFIKNSFNHTLLKSPSGFLTTKENSHEHGLGLKSVAKIVEACDGELRLNSEYNVFMATVILPTQRK